MPDRRRKALAARLRREKLDAFLATGPNNVRYLSGFTGEDSWLLVTRSHAVLLTDGRFAEQAETECPDLERHVRTGSITAALARVLKDCGVGTLAVEAEHMSVATCQTLRRKCRKTRICLKSLWVEDLRVIKDEAEIAALARAVRIAQRAWRRALAGGLEAGRPERTLAARLEFLMREGGADAAAFETIVAFDAHSSLPHARPGARKLRPGSAVLFDWGARVAGYNSDLTRCIAMDRMPDRIRCIYDVCLEAQRRAIRAIRPGAVCREVDQAARSYIESKGFGDAFGHGAGHGVGLDVHEAPSLNPHSETTLRPGMVVTVEPGIYLPGVGGVRIEDMALVTGTGCRLLTRLPKTAGKMEHLAQERTGWISSKESRN
jgi:Xaa-Pro aminopeptidase